MEASQYISLERRLYEARKVMPSETFRESLKAFLFSHIGEKNELWFAETIRTVEMSQDISETKNRIWQNIQRASKEREDLVSVENIIAFLRKPIMWKISIFLIASSLGLFFLSSFLLGKNVPQVSASSFEKVSGNVHILSGSQDSVATNGQKIFAEDILKTANSNATITFFDGSFLYLAPGSELKIEKLLPHPSFPDTGEIELTLQKGALWGRALSDPGNETGMTVTAGDISLVPYFATFSVIRNDDLTDIQILERAAQVSDRAHQKSGIFIAGTEIKFPENETQQVSFFTSLNPKEQFKNALVLDAAHRDLWQQKVLSDYQQETGVLPSSWWYPTKKWLERGTSPQEDLQKYLQLAKKRFHEAILLASRQEKLLSQQTLAEGVQMLTDLLAASPEAQPFVENLFLQLKKDLATAPFESSLADIRTAIMAAEAEVFRSSPFFLQRHILEYLWNMQNIILAQKAFIPKDLLDKYTALKELLPNAVTGDPEEKRNLLQVKVQELELLDFFSSHIFAKQLIEKNERKVVEEILAIAAENKNIPKLVWETPDQELEESPLQTFLQKVRGTSGSKAQREQVSKLLSEIEDTPQNLMLLQRIREEINADFRSLISAKMSDIIETEERKTIL